MLNITQKSLDLLPPRARWFVIDLQERYNEALASRALSADSLQKLGLAKGRKRPDYADHLSGALGKPVDLDAEAEKLAQHEEQLRERGALLEERLRELSATFSSIIRYLDARANALKPAPQLLDISWRLPPKSVTLASVREDIARLAKERAAVAQAQPVAGEIEARVRSQVQKLAAAGGARLGRDGGVSFSQQNAFALAAWLDGEGLIARLLRDYVEPENAMSSADKANRLAELDTEILALERVEEAVIRRDGWTAPRRPNANVLAVLGVREAADEAGQQPTPVSVEQVNDDSHEELAEEEWEISDA